MKPPAPLARVRIIAPAIKVILRLFLTLLLGEISEENGIRDALFTFSIMVFF
jgi:hypothetical protein